MLEMPQTFFHLDRENAMKKRLSLRLPIEYALSIFRFSKNGRVQELLHSLKYRNQPEIGVSLGRMYAEKLIEAGLQNAWDLIIPIPLHESRRRKRGYNQSAKFAEGLSERLHIPFGDNLMVRKTKTATQTRKSKLNRWENVESVFAVNPTYKLSHHKILLVDDVITTGATIEACGQVLLQSGVQHLSIACIAEA